MQRRCQSVHFKRHTTNDRFKTSASHGENVWSWKVNRQLKNDLDNLEQYGRRNLMRLSGIPEPVGEVDTTETVCKLISEIDPEYKPTVVIRSHKVGKISQPGSFNRKTRQIIVRLAVPSVKMRLLISRKNVEKKRIASNRSTLTRTSLESVPRFSTMRGNYSRAKRFNISGRQTGKLLWRKKMVRSMKQIYTRSLPYSCRSTGAPDINFRITSNYMALFAYCTVKF